MSLFRKNALDALSSPEQLDQPLRLLRPGQWLLLLSVGSFCVTIAIWSVFGRLPVRISGKGVLIGTNSLTVVQSAAAGRLLELNNQIGDCVKRGQVMARIDLVSQEVAKKEAQLQLQQLILQDQHEDQLDAIRIRRQKADIARIRSLMNSGAISLDQLSQREKELSSLMDSVEARNGQREQQIQQQQARINASEEEIERTAQIRAPIDGCVIDRNLHRGEVLQAGSPVFTLDAQDTALIKRLGLESLMDAVRTEPKGPLIEVKTSLQKDTRTISGYDWGGGPGPALKLTTGTPTNVRVLVEKRRPISYVIPILRDLTGIY